MSGREISRGHRSRQGRVPGDDDPLDLVARALRARSSRYVRARACRSGARRRLGEQRPVAVLGEQPRRRSRVVAGDDHRPRSERRESPRLRAGDDQRGLRRARTSASQASSESSEAAGRAAAARELEVTCVGPRRDGRLGDGRGRDAAASPGATSTQTTCGPNRPGLVGGLVGAGAAQRGRAVGDSTMQRLADVVRLEHGRVQVGDGRARTSSRRRPGDASPWPGRGRGSRPSARRSARAAATALPRRPRAERGRGPQTASRGRARHRGRRPAARRRRRSARRRSRGSRLDDPPAPRAHAASRSRQRRSSSGRARTLSSASRSGAHPAYAEHAVDRTPAVRRRRRR